MIAKKKTSRCYFFNLCLNPTKKKEFNKKKKREPRFFFCSVAQI